MSRYTFTVTYSCKYQLSFATNYKWSACGKCFNAKTGRLIKQVMKGSSIGYIINSKFYTAKTLRSKLELIPRRVEMPF